MRSNYRSNYRFSYRPKFSLISCLAVLLSVVLLASCRNEDGEQAFVDAVEIAELGVVSLQINSGPQGLTLEAGTSSLFTVSATLEDSSTIDASAEVQWSSDDSSVVSVDANGLLTAGATDGAAVISVRWGDIVANESVAVSTAALSALSFSNPPLSVSECLPGTQLSVAGVYTDRTSDITELVSSWTSSDSSLASVTSSGALNTFNSGAVDVTASYRGLSATQNITINDSLSALSITPSTDFDLEVGATQVFSAEGTENLVSRDVSSLASFSSSDTSVLTFGGATATATSNTGNAVVTASCGGLSSSAVSVSVVLEAEPTSVIVRYNGSSSDPAGPFSVSDSPIQLNVFLRLSNGSETDITTSDFVDWSVSSTISGTAATVNNNGSSKGEVRFVAVGRTEINVVYDDSDNSDYFEASIDVLVE